MCLMDTPNDPLARRPFRTTATLFAGEQSHVLKDTLADTGCSGAHLVINEALIPSICEQLQIEPVPLSRPKPLRGYDGKLAERPITHCIFPGLSIDGHREGTCPMLIAPLQHDLILGKPWMNKHKVVLDMMKDKILFLPGRCEHDGNTTSAPADLPFSPAPVSKVAPNKPPSPTYTSEDESCASEYDSTGESGYLVKTVE